MPIELATKYLPFVDELFSTEGKASLVTNNDFSFDGAETVKISKVAAVAMNDYTRNGALPSGQWSRYGAVVGLDASTESFKLTRDRSFTFELDALDRDETGNAVEAAGALARQLRQVVVPEMDAWTFDKMVQDAGAKPEAISLTPANIYEQIITGTAALDAAEAPDTGRVLMVTPATYLLMKQSPDIVLETDVGADMRIRGIISNLDGMSVMRVPASRLPEDFGFMIAHPVATVAPQKLASYKTHDNPPGINGSLVEGRVNYDAFVLENKAKAIYYQAGTE